MLALGQFFTDLAMLGVYCHNVNLRSIFPSTALGLDKLEVQFTEGVISNITFLIFAIFDCKCIIA